tara:strand:+ start:31 stop:162 length:132 start_codon:yes stop_codon:yes gene_type:complete
MKATDDGYPSIILGYNNGLTKGTQIMYPKPMKARFDIDEYSTV